jgi:hypothetical protein
MTTEKPPALHKNNFTKNLPVIREPDRAAVFPGIAFVAALMRMMRRKLFIATQIFSG